MNKLRNNVRGFSAIELLLVVIILAVIGFVGYQVLNSQDSKNETPNTAQQTPVDGSPGVDNAEDLDEAEEFVESTDIDSELDTTEIDEALSE